MQEINFDEKVEMILTKDSRYARDAYSFVRESLDHTQKQVGKENRGTGPPHHRAGTVGRHPATCPEPVRTDGPVTVLEEWGIHNSRDFGEIVFNMVEIELLAKTENDNRDDFNNGYDFTDAFRKPFWPPSRLNSEVKLIGN